MEKQINSAYFFIHPYLLNLISFQLHKISSNLIENASILKTNLKTGEGEGWSEALVGNFSNTYMTKHFLLRIDKKSVVSTTASYLTWKFSDME